MMIKTRFFLSLSLLAVILAACAPAAVTEAPSQSVVVQPSAAPFLSLATTLEVVTQAPVTTEAPTAFPVATSRGPNLEATDPTTVSLASGQYQFVEFFRFS